MDVIINANIDELPLGCKPLVTHHDYLLNLMTCLGFHEESPPVADFLRQSYQLEGEWLVIEPVYWEATHNDAMIMAAGNQLQLTDDESHTLFTDIAAFLAEDGLSLHYHNAHTWLVKVDGKAKITSRPTNLMLNQSMMSAIKDMDDTLYWQRVMTELQMLLGSHPCNQQETRPVPINGVWVYGYGRFAFDSNKAIMTDDEHLLASFPVNIARLSLDKPVGSNAIILINDYQKIVMSDLLAAIGNRSVGWFWNNIAWLTPRKSWWARLRGFC